MAPMNENRLLRSQLCLLTRIFKIKVMGNTLCNCFEALFRRKNTSTEYNAYTIENTLKQLINKLLKEQDVHQIVKDNILKVLHIYGIETEKLKKQEKNQIRLLLNSAYKEFARLEVKNIHLRQTGIDFRTTKEDLFKIEDEVKRKKISKSEFGNKLQLVIASIQKLDTNPRIAIPKETKEDIAFLILHLYIHSTSANRTIGGKQENRTTTRNLNAQTSSRNLTNKKTKIQRADVNLKCGSQTSVSERQPLKQPEEILNEKSKPSQNSIIIGTSTTNVSMQQQTEKYWANMNTKEDFMGEHHANKPFLGFSQESGYYGKKSNTSSLENNTKNIPEEEAKNNTQNGVLDANRINDYLASLGYIEVEIYDIFASRTDQTIKIEKLESLRKKVHDFNSTNAEVRAQKEELFENIDSKVHAIRESIEKHNFINKETKSNNTEAYTSNFNQKGTVKKESRRFDYNNSQQQVPTLGRPEEQLQATFVNINDLDQIGKKGNNAEVWFLQKRQDHGNQRNVMEKLSTQEIKIDFSHFEGHQSTDKLASFNIEIERKNNSACTCLEELEPKSMFTEMPDNRKTVKDTFDNISPTYQTEINNVKKRNVEETFSIQEDVAKKLQNSGIKCSAELIPSQIQNDGSHPEDRLKNCSIMLGNTLGYLNELTAPAKKLQTSNKEDVFELKKNVNYLTDIRPENICDEFPPIVAICNTDTHLKNVQNDFKIINAEQIYTARRIEQETVTNNYNEFNTMEQEPCQLDCTNSKQSSASLHSQKEQLKPAPLCKHDFDEAQAICENSKTHEKKSNNAAVQSPQRNITGPISRKELENTFEAQQPTDKTEIFKVEGEKFNNQLEMYQEQTQIKDEARDVTNFEQDYTTRTDTLRTKIIMQESDHISSTFSKKLKPSKISIAQENISSRKISGELILSEMLTENSPAEETLENYQNDIDRVVENLKQFATNQETTRLERKNSNKPLCVLHSQKEQLQSTTTGHENHFQKLGETYRHFEVDDTRINNVAIQSQHHNNKNYVKAKFSTEKTRDACHSYKTQQFIDELVPFKAEDEPPDSCGTNYSEVQQEQIQVNAAVNLEPLVIMDTETSAKKVSRSKSDHSSPACPIEAKRIKMGETYENLSLSEDVTNEQQDLVSNHSEELIMQKEHVQTEDKFEHFQIIIDNVTEELNKYADIIKNLQPVNEIILLELEQNINDLINCRLESISEEYPEIIQQKELIYNKGLDLKFKLNKFKEGRIICNNQMSLLKECETEIMQIAHLRDNFIVKKEKLDDVRKNIDRIESNTPEVNNQKTLILNKLKGISLLESTGYLRQCSESVNTEILNAEQFPFPKRTNNFESRRQKIRGLKSNLGELPKEYPHIGAHVELLEKDVDQAVRILEDTASYNENVFLRLESLEKTKQAITEIQNAENIQIEDKLEQLNTHLKEMDFRDEDNHQKIQLKKKEIHHLMQTFQTTDFTNHEISLEVKNQLNEYENEILDSNSLISLEEYQSKIYEISQLVHTFKGAFTRNHNPIALTFSVRCDIVLELLEKKFKQNEHIRKSQECLEKIERRIITNKKLATAIRKQYLDEDECVLRSMKKSLHNREITNIIKDLESKIKVEKCKLELIDKRTYLNNLKEDVMQLPFPVPCTKFKKYMDQLLCWKQYVDAMPQGDSELDSQKQEFLLELNICLGHLDDYVAKLVTSKKQSEKILELESYFDFKLDSSKVSRNCVEFVKEIKEKAWSFDESVKYYLGSKYSIDYYIIHENLLRLLQELHKVVCEDDDEQLLDELIETMNYVKGLIRLLDSNATDK
ncbi:centromere-associated protein E-like isoform X2 [Zophobas morio]|uniref:centromere-associated protein E-like isoform X2 n=1 Tax=Zophobas morio TaxID=2755281 RepID=UPI003082CBA4